MKLIKSIAILLWLVVCIFVFLTLMTSLEFVNENVRLIATFVFTSSLPLILRIGIKNSVLKRSLFVAFAFLFLVTVFVFRWDIAMNWGGGFKTQELLYTSKGNPSQSIEFQMKDLGAFGYARRTVEIEPCCFFFRKVRLVDEEKVDKTQWKYIGKDVNELGLKYP